LVLLELHSDPFPKNESTAERDLDVLVGNRGEKPSLLPSGLVMQSKRPEKVWMGSSNKIPRVSNDPVDARTVPAQDGLD